MDPTQTTAGDPSDASSNPLVRGQEIYDQIMAEVEPELVTATLATLGEKYKDETPEQAQARAARYEAAFAEYDKRYATYMADLSGKVHSLQRTVRAGIETDDRKEEENALTSLENSITSA